ncbi:MAG: DUF4383 domain-containing protein [bacterium]
MAKTYARVTGTILAALGIAGFLMKTPWMGMEFSTAHNLLHLFSGAAALYMASADRAERFARIFGIFYAGLAILGFAGMSDIGPLILHLNRSYNIIHLLIGALGLFSGFAGGKPATLK